MLGYFKTKIKTLRRCKFKSNTNVDYSHHAYGGKVVPCPYYSSWFDFDDIPYWRSVGKKEDVEQQIDNFFTEESNISPKMEQALEVVLQELDKFFPETLSPYEDEVALDCLPKDTSPGFPYNITDPGKNKGELRTTILEDYRQRMKTNVDNFDIPCSAGVRLALARKPKNKPRLVWVYPAQVQIAEAKYFMPLYSQLYKCRYFSWDFSFLRGEHVELEKFLKGCALSYGTDVSNFDATVPVCLTKKIFTWISSKFRFTSKQWREYKAVTNYFLNTPLWYKKNLYFKRKGVPSGSCFTQLIDSLINLVYQVYIYHEATNQPYSPYRLNFFDVVAFIRVLGDDALVAFRQNQFEYPDFIRATQQLKSMDIIIHPEKGFFRGGGNILVTVGTCEFLGFTMPTIHSNIRSPFLRKDTDLVMSQCLFPEQEEKHAGIALARLIGIKWSCGDSYECHEVVDYFHELFEERWSDVKPTDLPLEFRHLFNFVFGRIKIPVDKYPNTEEVVDRYIKCNTTFKRRLNQCASGDYRSWIIKSWRPVEIGELRSKS